VECPEDFPFDIPAGETVDCDYEADADAAVDGTNTATVTGEFSHGEAIDVDATESYEFVLDTELHATVDVDDLSSEFGAQDFGSLNAADMTAGDITSFDYSETFTYEGVGNCEELTIDNTATVSSEDGLSESDDETVIIQTECIVFQGETATGEGDPWSEIGAKKKDRVNTWFEYSPLATSSKDIVTGRKLTDIGGFTYDAAEDEICFVLDEPWLFADVSGNVKIEPLDEKPTSYISPGQFDIHATLSGDSGCVDVPDDDEVWGYAIHLDVGQFVSLGFGDLA
jgi:hypothetical protein